MVWDLQQCFTISCSLFALTNILVSHRYSVSEQQKHIQYALETMSTDKRSFNFCESVFTSVSGGARYYVLSCERVSKSCRRTPCKCFASGLTGKLPWLLGNSAVSSTDVPNHRTLDSNKHGTLHVNCLVPKTCRQCPPSRIAKSLTGLMTNFREARLRKGAVN